MKKHLRTILSLSIANNVKIVFIKMMAQFGVIIIQSHHVKCILIPK